MISFIKGVAMFALVAAAPAWSQVAATDTGSGAVLSGAFDASIKNDYITPRGVVVTTHGVAVQTSAAATLTLSSGLAFTGGVWVDFNPGYGATSATTRDVNETDPFFIVSGKVGDHLKLSAGYVPFIGNNFARTAHNVEFGATYDDSAPGQAFSINPYAKFFYEISGSSTTGVGKNGKTFDVEIGAVPSLALGGVTLAAPTWFTVGPKKFFGPIDDGSFGVFSTGLKILKPLDLGPRAGKWTVYATAQYFYLANDNLVLVKSALNDGDHKSSQLQFGVGVNIGF